MIRIIFANHIEKKYMFVVYSLIINSQKHSTIVIKNCLKTQQIFLLTIALLIIRVFLLALFYGFLNSEVFDAFLMVAFLYMLKIFQNSY